MNIPYIYIVYANRNSASKNADFPQLVSVMRLSSGECAKCVQITYLTSIKCSSFSNEIRAQSVTNTTQREMYLMNRYKKLQLNIKEI